MFFLFFFCKMMLACIHRNSRGICILWKYVEIYLRCKCKIHFNLPIEYNTRSLLNSTEFPWYYLSLKLECALSFSHGYYKRYTLYKNAKNSNTERCLGDLLCCLMPLNPAVLTMMQNDGLLGKIVKSFQTDVRLLV